MNILSFFQECDDTISDKIGDTISDTIEDTIGDTISDKIGDTIGDKIGDTIGDTIDDKEIIEMKRLSEIKRRNTFTHPINIKLRPIFIKSKSLQTIDIKNTVRILFVDDIISNNKIIHKIVCNELQKITYRKIETKLVEDGIHALRDYMQYHIIFMDVQMPVMNGFLTTTMIRKHGYTGYIVGCTSVVANEIDYFISCGANEVIEKPIRPYIINQVLLRALNKIDYKM
jgi:CheY-like chemotaxis protein